MISAKKEFLSLVKSKRLSYTVILFGCTLIVVFHLLPSTLQYAISNFIRLPIVMLLLLTFILCLGYFNMLSGVMLLLIFTCFLIPLSNNNINNHNMNHRRLNLDNSYVIESFTSSQDDEDNEDEDDDEEDFLETKLTGNKTISNFFKPGYFRNKINDANKYNKEKYTKQKASDNHTKYVEKRKKHGEKFTSVGGKNGKISEDFLAIEKRKFNPGNEEDTNFLLALETFKDVINRIEYKYENKKLLKKYIKNQLEDVIEMLDLVPEE